MRCRMSAFKIYVEEEATEVHTSVAIIGAGPAGLLLSHLLHHHGIDSVIIERSSRVHVESRIRAGHLEPATVEALVDANFGGRITKQGLHHSGVLFHYHEMTRRIDLQRLTGQRVTIFGQTEICKDLISARLNCGGVILFQSTDVTIANIHNKPQVEFKHDDKNITLTCDFIAGCDGFHSVCRKAMGSAVSTYELTYPYNWLGILARARPVAPELVYAPHERGLALCSMRTPEIVRHYLQISPDEKIEHWPDARIWAELRRRLSGRERDIEEGPIIDKRIFPLRSFVAEPMQLGKLFLAGDAAHIVPPSAAKGLNMAVADAKSLAASLVQYYENNDGALLESYSERAKNRIWEGQRFSRWMTHLFHYDSTSPVFDRRSQVAELDRLFHSEIAAKNFAEAYVGSV